MWYLVLVLMSVGYMGHWLHGTFQREGRRDRGDLEECVCRAVGEGRGCEVGERRGVMLEREQGRGGRGDKEGDLVEEREGR